MMFYKLQKSICYTSLTWIYVADQVLQEFQTNTSQSCVDIVEKVLERAPHIFK